MRNTDPFTKGDNLKTNYRPVSILTVMSKLHEDVMNDQLWEYFVNIFEDLLCAYRESYNFQSALVKIVDDWKVLLDKNHIIWVIFMDPPKLLSFRKKCNNDVWSHCSRGASLL